MASTNASFSATGVGATFAPTGSFNVELRGTFQAVLVLERSLDAGTSYVAVSVDVQGNPNAYSRPISLTLNEPEAGALYRWNCQSWISGTAVTRISQ